MARPTWIVALVVALVGIAPGAEARSHREFPPSQQTSTPADSRPWDLQFETWVTAVTAHRPGAADGAVTAISTWTETELDAVLADLLALRRALARAYMRSREPDLTYRRRRFRLDELRTLLGLSDREAQKGDWNRLLTRGAMLHADIGMLIPTSPTVGAGATRHQVVVVLDGIIVGYDNAAFHFAFGRSLLAAVTPDPAQDETARLWYLATTLYLLESRKLADVQPHLDRAERLFASDADILFECGYLREAFAAPRVQNIFGIVDVGSPPAHLREAEKLYRRAADANPALAETRVHLGRILELLGRHAEGAAELRQALGSAQERPLRYYANLFLGDAEQALGHAPAARECYERAVALYPRAQSPRLAAGQLARRSGDRATAIQAIAQALHQPVDTDFDVDPWWTYHRWQVRNAHDLFAALHARLQEAVSR